MSGDSNTTGTGRRETFSLVLGVAAFVITVGSGVWAIGGRFSVLETQIQIYREDLQEQDERVTRLVNDLEKRITRVRQEEISRTQRVNQRQDARIERMADYVLEIRNACE